MSPATHSLARVSRAALLALSSLCAASCMVPVAVRERPTGNIRTDFERERIGQELVVRYGQPHGERTPKITIGHFDIDQITEDFHSEQVSEKLAFRSCAGGHIVTGLTTALSVATLGLMLPLIAADSSDHAARARSYGEDWVPVGYWTRFFYVLNPVAAGSWVTTCDMSYDRVKRNFTRGARIGERFYTRRLAREGSKISVGVDGKASTPMKTNAVGLIKVPVPAGPAEISVQLDVAGCRKALEQPLRVRSGAKPVVVMCR